MKETPIMFTPEHVRAILDGRKTQTRRTVKGEPLIHNGAVLLSPRSGLPYNANKVGVIRSPYGAPGDLLWVREAWAAAYDSDGDIITSDVVYKASNPDHQAYRRTGPFETYEIAGHTGWRHAMYMPRWASRLTLRITEVRVERLQDMPWQDVIKEGIPQHTVARGVLADNPPDPRWAYIKVWDDINGKRAPWASNPWVWAITFEVV